MNFPPSTSAQECWKHSSATPLSQYKSLEVAVVLSHFDLSGVTTNTIDLCEGLVNIGHSVTLLVGNPKADHQKKKAAYLRSKGVSVREIHDLHAGKIDMLKAFFDLSKELLSKRYDAIHLESIYLSFIPKLLRKKFVVTLHSWGLKKNIFAPRATRIIAISKGMQEEAIIRHGYNNADIDIVLHGVSPRFARPISDYERMISKSRYDIPEGKIIIGIVGSIQPRKGHHYLLEAVSSMSDRLKKTVHLVFCGNPITPVEETWINNEIDKYQMRSMVTRISHTDPVDVYPCLDIFCLPSVWEGFALVAIEAMLGGLCVLRSDVQGAAEQIDYGVTGFTFKSGNVEDLREILSNLIANPNMMRKVGRQGQEYALQNFTLNTMAANTIEVYKKLQDNE